MSSTAEAGSTPLEPPRNVVLDPDAVVGGAADNRWTVVRHIADGGFSSVYEICPANAETAQRHGAVSHALKCLWGTPEELDQVAAEADKTVAVEGHDNVLSMITSFPFGWGAGAHAEPQYFGLVLELAAEDLYDVADRAAPSERAWVAIFEQVAAGLAHIHARRIVHGDIKPTNLLRVGPRFTIADFGISAPLETTRGAPIGLARTISFWPPETRNQGSLDDDGVRRPPPEGWHATQKGDVWALAVSMHRILTGRHITTGSTPEQQYELVCAGRYAVDDRLSGGVRELLQDCLVYDPAERPVTTAAQLRERLAELVLPIDYDTVPWPDEGPRLVALLPADGRTLAMYQTKPGGRVQGAFIPGSNLLLDAHRHLAEVVVPSLAQQARDGQRAVVRLAQDAERLRELEYQLSMGDSASTQVVFEAELEQRTRQLSHAMAEVTRERDQLRRQYDELAHRLERLERDDRARPEPPHHTTPGVPYHPLPRRSPFTTLGRALFVLFLLTVAVILGMVTAVYLFPDADPIGMMTKLWHRFVGLFGSS